MSYKYQGIGGGGPLPTWKRFVGGVIFCIVLCAYFATIAWLKP